RPPSPRTARAEPTRSRAPATRPRTSRRPCSAPRSRSRSRAAGSPSAPGRASTCASIATAAGPGPWWPPSGASDGGGPMANDYAVSIDIDAPPEAVWAVVGDPVGIPRWYATYVACEVDGDVRRLRRADGGELVERILERDEPGRSYA